MNVLPDFLAPVDRDIMTVPFDELFEEWERRTDGYKNLPMVKALALYDRYFLFVQILGRKDGLHPWLYERCREVERAPDGHLDCWAREHFKSSLITFAGAIQEILRDPEISIGLFSYNQKLSRSFLKQIKVELESNEKLITLFPEILYEDANKEAPSWSVENGLIVKRKTNPKEPTISAHGLVDGMPTGMHFRLRIYDDVVTDASVNTPEQIQKTTDAYSLSQSLGVQNGREWVIGTRYSYSDTYEWILNRGALIPRIYAATDDGTKEGKPVFFTQDAWDDRCLKQTDADIACQMLQNPLSGQMKMFNVEDLIEYEIRPETLAVYIMCDPARSKKKGSDNTAILVVGIDYAMNKYILDGMNHRMDLKERWENFAALYMRWRVQPGVQTVKCGYEVYGAQADLDYFKEQMRLPGRPRFDIEELAWPREGEGSKIDRVQRLVPDCKTHKIFFPYPTNEKNLTANQRKMKDNGYGYRISQPIRRKNEDGVVYDLSEALKKQFHYFPVGKKDAIDALSRIYDMEPRAPISNEPKYLEPEFV